MAETPASTFIMGNLHVPMPSAYSAKVDTGFAHRIRANYRLGAFSRRLTGFRLAGKCSAANLRRFASAKLTIEAARSGSLGANSVCRTRPARIRLRFVLKINNFGARSAVDERRFGCGRTPPAVAPIPQITSLDPGRPPARSGDCSRQRRIKPTGVGVLRAYQTIVSESFL